MSAPPDSARRASHLAAAAGVVAGIWLGGAGAANGDAAAYTHQLVAGDLTARPSHLGYLLLARTAGLFWPGEAARLLDTLSALALGAVALAAARLAGGTRPAVAAAVAVALGLPWAPFGEVDLPLAAAVGAAAAIRPAAPAAAAWALACAISPGALGWAPAVLLARHAARTPTWSVVAGGALIWAVGVSPWAAEIAGGHRGLLEAWGTRLPVGRALHDGLGELAPAPLSPLLLLGLLTAPGAALPALAATLGGAFGLDRVPGVGGQLATVPFVAAVAARGAHQLTLRWPGIGPWGARLLVALALAGGFRAADLQRWAVARETTLLRALAARVGPGERVEAPWGWGQRYAAVAPEGASWQEPSVPAGVGAWLLPPGTVDPDRRGVPERVAGGWVFHIPAAPR